MQTGKASRTALRVAIRRAAHAIADVPAVLDDALVLRLIGPGHENDLERAMHPVGRDFRAFMAARSRYAEDQLAAAVRDGIQQYVILGAGFDTFAYRNPHPHLRVFEVDFPATQEDKRARLAAARIGIPPNLIFVPLDLEHKTLSESLAECGFEDTAPAYFSWLGVVPYLTLAAFRATLRAIAQLPSRTAVTFDYGFPPDSLAPARRAIFYRLAARVAAAGEPFQLFFNPREMESELQNAGFHRIEQIDHEGLNARYFADRADGLKLSPVGLGMIASAQV